MRDKLIGDFPQQSIFPINCISYAMDERRRSERQAQEAREMKAEQDRQRLEVRILWTGQSERQSEQQQEQQPGQQPAENQPVQSKNQGRKPKYPRQPGGIS